MARTPTLPPTDSAMWRKVLARCHPDTGGEHELFVWAHNVRELVLSGVLEEATRRRAPRRPPEPEPQESASVPYDPAVDHDLLTDRALSLAEAVGEPFSRVLWLLEGCHSADSAPLFTMEGKGATYKQLAAIAHRFGMSGEDRSRFYRIAEEIPLSRRHAGHILSKRL